MPYKLSYDNITKIKTDAIIIPANVKPVCVPGIMTDVYMAADTDKLLQVRNEAGVLKEGEVFDSASFGLKSGRIIYAIMPLPERDDKDRCEILHKCYRNALKCALKLGCTSVALPVFISDAYDFSARKAMDIALDEVNAFLNGADMCINIILNNSIVDLSISEELITKIDEYLGLTGQSKVSNRVLLEDTVKLSGESFSDRLFRLIDEKRYTDAEVYKRANVDRRVISKIRMDANKGVNKNTALALAVGLQLSLDETKDFIALAGWALSPSFVFDRIVSFFISNGKYDMDDINEVLFRYTGKTLAG